MRNKTMGNPDADNKPAGQHRQDEQQPQQARDHDGKADRPGGQQGGQTRQPKPDQNNRR